MTAPAPFIVCHPRSGSTLLRLMLDSHPDVAIPPETHFCRLFDTRAVEGPLSGWNRQIIHAAITRSPRWSDFGLDADELGRHFAGVPDGVPAGRCLAAFWEFYARQHGKTRWGDKTPQHAGCAARIASILPESRFVHIVRDGRDVAASIRSVWFGRGKRVGDLAAGWRRRMLRFRRETAHLTSRLLTVHYEDLVSDPAEVLRVICEFVELEYHPGMLAYSARAESRLAELGDLRTEERTVGRAERIAIHAMTTRPPTTERIGMWRQTLSDAEVALFEEVAGEVLRSLGYRLTSDSRR
jgi:hypothetical protein